MRKRAGPSLRPPGRLVALERLARGLPQQLTSAGGGVWCAGGPSSSAAAHAAGRGGCAGALVPQPPRLQGRGAVCTPFPPGPSPGRFQGGQGGSPCPHLRPGVSPVCGNSHPHACCAENIRAEENRGVWQLGQPCPSHPPVVPPRLGGSLSSPDPHDWEGAALPGCPGVGRPCHSHGFPLLSRTPALHTQTVRPADAD